MGKIMIISIFLGVGTIYDIRYKQIPDIWFILFGSLAAVGLVSDMCNHQWNSLLGSIPGLFFLLLSKASREQLGYGDSLALVIIGAMGSPGDIIYIIMFSFILAAVISGIIFLFKRVNKNYSIPFFPVMLLAYFCKNIGIAGGI